MSEACDCFTQFPERAFKSASDADSFMSGVRLSSVFRFSGTDEGEITREKYRCRKCGRDWVCRIPSAPPYTWGPAIPVEEPRRGAAPVAPPPPRSTPDAGDRVPVASAVFLEPGGARREKIGPFTVVYEDEAAEDVPKVLRTLTAWRPGLQSWCANAGLADVEIEVGARLDKRSSVFEVFAVTWPREHINPGWRAMRGGKTWRPVHLRGIRERTAAGFAGEYYLVVVDVRMESVVAWMMAEAKA